MTCLGLRLKTGPGGSKLAAKIPPPTKNGPHACAVFTSIIEATIFSKVQYDISKV